VEAGAKLVLGFGGTDTIGALTLGGTVLPDGTYDATTHPAFLDGTGQLVVVTPLDSFASWAADLGLSGDPDADYDRDGLADALEYVFGTDPKAADAGGAITTGQSGDLLLITFTRDDRSKTTDISLTVETGSDLAGWPDSFVIGESTAGSSPGVTVTPNGDGTDTIRVAIPKNGATRMFARVKVRVS
jgi:hypothetical protein